MVYGILRVKLCPLRLRMSVWFAFLLGFCLLMIFKQGPTSWNKFRRVSLRHHALGDRVTRECRKFTWNETVDWGRLYLYQDLKKNKSIIWCKVPKAGSTSLTRILLSHAGAKEVEDDIRIHYKLRHFFPKLSTPEMKAKLNTTFKFLVVRHPFERLLSAYRDKLEDYSREPLFSSKHGNLMVKRPRVNGTILMPTFPEFINYLLETSPETYDEHWKSISEMCTPCTIHYDAIVELEYFNEDIKLPLSHAGIHEDVGWAHSTGTSNKTIEKYFQQLSLTQIHQLYHIYRKDFLLFGYTPDKYFSIALQHESAKGTSTLAPILQSERQLMVTAVQ